MGSPGSFKVILKGIAWEEGGLGIRNGLLVDPLEGQGCMV